MDPVSSEDLSSSYLASWVAFCFDSEYVFFIILMSLQTLSTASSTGIAKVGISHTTERPERGNCTVLNDGHPLAVPTSSTLPLPPPVMSRSPVGTEPSDCMVEHEVEAVHSHTFVRLDSLICVPRSRVVLCVSNSDQLCVVRGFSRVSTEGRIPVYPVSRKFLLACVDKFGDDRDCPVGFTWRISRY